MNLWSPGRLQNGHMKPVTVAACALLVACAPTSELPQAPPVDAPSQTSTPAADWLDQCSAGTRDGSVDGYQVRVHFPEGAAPTGGFPAVVVLHGAGDSGPDVQQQSEFDELGDTERFMTVFPSAPGGNWALNDRGVTFLNNLVTSLRCADPDRIFLTGFSRGSAMAFRTACSGDTRRFAAFGGVALADYTPGCRKSAPAAWIYFHGDSDKTVSYQRGFTLASGRQTLPAESAMSKWAMHNHCRVGPITSRIGADVVLRRWASCRARAGVTFYTIRQGDHQWPFKSRPNAPVLKSGQSWAGVGTSSAMWRFFSRRSLATSGEAA